MKMDQWIKKNLGRAIDYDGVYDVQCVDLIKHFVKNVLGFEPQSIGNAIEYYNKRKTSNYLTKNFKWIDNTADFIPQKGDICVFTSKSGLGHISVAAGEGTKSYFYSYDQNYPRSIHEPMTKIKHTYSSFLGVLRAKKQNNIVDPPIVKEGKYKLLADRGVYADYGSKSGLMSVEELTKDGRAHATSKKPKDKAYLKKNTSVTITEVKHLSTGHLWAKIPSGYICIWNYQKDKMYIKKAK